MLSYFSSLNTHKFLFPIPRLSAFLFINFAVFQFTEGLDNHEVCYIVKMEEILTN